MKNSKTKRYFMMLMIIGVLLFAGAIGVSAAPFLRQLSPNTLYKSYDFTGDGIKDRFYFYPTGSYYGFNTKTNGITQSFDYVQYGVYVYKYNAKNTFLIVNHHAGGYGTGVDIYRYSNGKFQSATDVGGVGSTNQVLVYKVKGKELWLTAKNRKSHQSLSFKQVRKELPTWIERYKVNTSKHKVVLASKYATCVGTKVFKYCGDNILKTNSSPNKSDGKGVAIQYGTTVRFLQVYIKKSYSTYGGVIYPEYRRAFKVKANGKTGWFYESTLYPFTDAY